MIRPFVVALSVASFAAGCQSTTDALSNEPSLSYTVAEAPPGAAPGSCWGKDISPAVVETVTDQIILQPAELGEGGQVLTEAIYKTEVRQEIVQERKETWFETPCADALTPEFIASLQRALKARGLYRGAINGQMDGRTRAAVRRYQQPQNLDSGILSLTSARALGLVALQREASES